MWNVPDNPWEITTLEQTEPPKDFTADTIKAWLESIKAAPDEGAIHLLIERIDIGGEKIRPLST